MLSIRPAVESDIESIADIHSKVFSRQADSLLWVSCNFKAFPRISFFVAELDRQVVGYIQWIEKSGFRKEAVLELEQIAVLPDMQGKKIGTSLINQSVALIQKRLATRNASLKHVLVSTRDDNPAKQLYANTLNAKAEYTISNLYSADEVMMISRNINIEKKL
jgi:ribosomal protein S18 acetylase RimI-like enzyme